MVDQAELSAVGDRMKDNPVLQLLGRVGVGCYGLVHVVVAVLALRVAFGDKGSELDQRGAITTIAAAPFGAVLLWVIAVGLFAFGLWQVLAAAVGFRWIEGKRTGKRLGALGRAVAVWAVAVLAVRLLLSDPTSSESAQQRGWTGRLLELPGGRVLVIVVGLGVLAGAITMGVNGIRQSFLTDMDPRRLRGKAASACSAASGWWPRASPSPWSAC